MHSFIPPSLTAETARGRGGRFVKYYPIIIGSLAGLKASGMFQPVQSPMDHTG